MERMTFEGDFCVIARCSDIPGDSLCEDGTCFQLRVWERLKAIEDVLGNEYDLNRLRELAQADREGRCVVQRFSPGQVVWAVERNEDGEAVDFYGYVFVTSLRGIALVSPKINGSSEIDVILMDQVESRISSSGGSIEAYPIDDCYLTREEAEKALKGEGHETDPV